MLGLPLFINTIPSPSDDWEYLWRKRRADLVLNGITLKEHFQERVRLLDQLLGGVIDRFRKTELVATITLKTVAEIIEQIDTEFLGIEAWQQAQELPDMVRALSSIEAVEKIQSCLGDIRRHIRLMQMLLRQYEKDPLIAFRYPETSEKLARSQEEVLNLFRTLRTYLRELAQHL